MTEPVLEFTVRDDMIVAWADQYFPGVLLRLRWPYQTYLYVERSLAEGEWEPVRSGHYARTPQGEGWVYDCEAPPGRTVAYRVTQWPSGSNEQTIAVDVRPLRSCEAWLTPLMSPDLSTRVRVMHPWEPTADGTALVTELPGGARVVTGVGESALGMLSGRSIFRTTTEASWRRLQATLRTPGAILLRASREHALDDIYVAVTGVEHARPGSSYGFTLRDTVVSWVEVRRPATENARMIIPGWTFHDAINGVSSLEVLAQQHETWGDRARWAVTEVDRFAHLPA